MAIFNNKNEIQQIKTEHIGKIVNLIKENLQRPFDEAIQTVIGGASSSSDPNARVRSPTERRASSARPLSTARDLAYEIPVVVKIEEWIQDALKKLSFNEIVAMANVRVKDGLAMSNDISSYTDNIRDKKSLLKMIWKHDNKKLAKAKDLEQSAYELRHQTTQARHLLPMGTIERDNRRKNMTGNSPVKKYKNNNLLYI